MRETFQQMIHENESKHFMKSFWLTVEFICTHQEQWQHIFSWKYFTIWIQNLWQQQTAAAEAKLVHLLIMLYNMFVRFKNINNVKWRQKKWHLQVLFLLFLSSYELNMKLHAIISSPKLYFWFCNNFPQNRAIVCCFWRSKQQKARKSKSIIFMFTAPY